jgi:hypothetical protein
MKISNGTEFRFATPKPSRLQKQFICLAGFCFILSWIIGQTGRAWIVGIGELSLVGALVTLLVARLLSAKSGRRRTKLMIPNDAG